MQKSLRHVLCASVIVSLTCGAQAFDYTEKPTLDMIPDAAITGQAGGQKFEAKTVAFEPSHDGSWSMLIADKEFGATDIIMSCQEITIDLPQLPAAGVKMSKPMDYGKGFFQINKPTDPKETTSWNADNAWVLEITAWNVKPWDATASMFQQAGTASGKIAVCYKGAGEFKNAWVAGTFKDVPVRYMGEPPAALKKAMANPPPKAPADTGGSAKGVALKPVGKAGDWRGTICGAGCGEALFTVEKSGRLYQTDPATGEWKGLGKPDFAATKFLLAVGSDIFSIGTNGNLGKIDSSDGSCQSVGPAGGWANTTAATSGDGRIFTTERSGALYVTDPATGTWKKLGKPEFADSAFLLYAAKSLFLIDTAGNLFQVDPATGTKTAKGKPADWKNTIAAVALNDVLFSIESSGALYATDPDTGSWKQIGSAAHADANLFFVVGSKLFLIDKNGSLCEIGIE